MFFINLCCQQYSSEWYTTDNGLPQNSVKDIVKDRYGYIWLSTEQGIIRYDGNTFEHYFGTGISNLHFKIFFGSKQNDSLMIFNEYDRNGILIHRRRPQMLSHSPAVDGESLSGVHYTYYRKRNLGEPTSFGPYMIRLRTSKYLFTKNKITYLAGKKPAIDILMPFDPADMKDVFVFEETIFIRNPRTGKIISITKGKASQIAHPLLSGPGTILYWEQVNNQVFAVYKETIYQVIYTGNKLSVRKILYYPGFGNHQFYAIFYDAQYRHLYLGSLTKGLQILKRMSFSCVKNQVPFEVPLFHTLLPYGRSQVVTPDGFIFNSSRMVRQSRFKRGNSKSSMIYDENRNIICFRDSTLETYHRRSFQLIREKTFDFAIRNIFRSGNLYYICGIQGNKNILLEFKDPAFLKISRTHITYGTVECIRRYNENYLFIGCSDGLYILDQRNGKLNKINSTVGVKNITRTSEGNFWVLSQANGIFLIKNNRLLKMPADKNRNLISSHDLLEDKNGFLWISTNNGLYRVRKKELLEYAENPAAEVHYYRFSTKDGLNTNEFNGGGKPGATVLEDGHFVFPSMDGLVFFRPEEVSDPFPLTGSVSAERVKINDSIRTFNNTLFLSKDYQKAELYIDIPFYGQKENLLIEAQVDNSTNKWALIGENRTFILENISSGSHVLTIRALTASGDYTYKKVPFYIEPYVYETLWFRATGLFVILLGMVLFARKIRKRFTRQNEILQTVKDQLEDTEVKLENETSYQEHLFQAITHDIATPIKHLSNLSQMILGTENPDLQRKYVDRVYKSMEELYHLTINMREYRHAFNNSGTWIEKEYKLRDAIEMKIKIFEDVAKYNATVIINRIQPSIYLNISQSIIGIILHNLLDNAVKNTRAGEIIFDAYPEDDYMVITLSDTGKGMKKDQLNYYNTLYESTNENDMVFKNFGLGLHLVIRLVKKIQAQIEFTDNNQLQGTLVIIKIHTICLEKY